MSKNSCRRNRAGWKIKHFDFASAITSAGFYAKKLYKTMFVYPGNSYGFAIWRVTYKPSEYLNSINNTGDVVFSGAGRFWSGRYLFSVTPYLTVTRHETVRGDFARSAGC